MTLAITGGGRIHWWDMSDVGGVVGIVGVMILATSMILFVCRVTKPAAYGATAAGIVMIAWIGGSPHAIFGGVRPAYIASALAMLLLLAPAVYLLLLPFRMYWEVTTLLAIAIAAALLWLVYLDNPNRDRYLNCPATYRLMTGAEVEITFVDDTWLRMGSSIRIQSPRLVEHLNARKPSMVSVRVWYPVSRSTYTYHRIELAIVIAIDGIAVDEGG